MKKTDGALRILVPFVQFKKREKHQWRSVNFSKGAGFKQRTTNMESASNVTELKK